MLTIKLNENTNSGMLYAIAYCEDPDIYSEEFWGWDTESDVGYELMEFGSLIQDADVFDSLEAAEDRADDVLSSIFEDEVFIVGLDPYTPHNLTGFVKKITRDSINESKFINEELSHAITLYRGTRRIVDRDKMISGIYLISHNDELDFGLDFDTASGYGPFVVKLEVDNLKLKNVDIPPATLEEKTNIVELGYDGVIHFNQVYLYNLEKLQGIPAEYVIKIADTEKILKHTKDSSMKPVDALNVLSGEYYYASANGFDKTYNGDSIVLVQVNIIGGTSTVRVPNYGLGIPCEDLESEGIKLYHAESLNESISIKESNINTKTLIVCPNCKSSDSIILTGPTTFADYDKYLYQPCTCDKCGCKFEANFKKVTDYNVISQGTLDLDESTVNTNENTGYNPEYSSYIEEVAQRFDAGEYDDAYEVCEYVAKKFNRDIDTVRDDINKLISGSKSIEESNKTPISSIARDYVEVAYICDGFTNFRVYGGGFKTSDALVAVEDEKGKRLRLAMGDVCEFYTWHDAKGNVIHEPTYYSED